MYRYQLLLFTRVHLQAGSGSGSELFTSVGFIGVLGYLLNDAFASLLSTNSQKHKNIFDNVFFTNMDGCLNKEVSRCC